jgi:hypothetical protein
VIVRILGEGQYRLDDAAYAAVSEIDDRVQVAAEAGDEAGFATALSELLDAIVASGTELAPDEFEGSDAVIPGHGTTLAEAQDLLSSEGLIPS